MVSQCDETLSGPKDAGYRGCQTRTVSGRTCQAWSADSPHVTNKKIVTETNVADGLDSNYCRNLNGFLTIWCYTDDPDLRWEYCEPIGKYGYLGYSDKDHTDHPKGSLQADYTKSSAMTINLHRDCPPAPTSDLSANLAAESPAMQIHQEKPLPDLPVSLAAERPAMQILQQNPLTAACFAGALALAAVSGVRRSRRNTGDLYVALAEQEAA